MQPINKSRSLTEGGILASIAIIFALISVYIPVLALVVNLIWPVPILLLGVRHGFKVSLMCLAVAGIIIAMLINPFQAASVVLGFGFIGVAIGYAINHGWSPTKTMVVGTIASCLSKAAVLLLGFYVLGFNPITTNMELMNDAAGKSIEIYRNMGIPETQLEQTQIMFDKMLEMLKFLMPAAFLLASVVDTFINYWLAKKILARLGQPLPGFAPFTTFVNPLWMLLVFGSSMLVVTFYNDTPNSLIYHIGVNLQFISSAAFLLQGLANARFIINQNGWPKLAFNILLFLIFINQFIAQLVVLFGAFDLYFDYRKLGINKKI